ncbi:wax ester/triacylglycerol synthase family O-acyltransferase [Pseudomaricurvus alcaniphilus]|uniref:WS/DGAT/MGAT family O-acyltransferase n=1 Tax=Pseudomaricurvus alcaniphilus TaxID=1166482 RepID=UPI00140D00BB|nr:wax ester/triacylglycerol synthase family O-acyltransferase [Pseudomaricurvus alcaniphilus]NHN38998.1 wax ester/triacylglycerol synthase family O-acyltransferase [Pseudomaricurvus alcaniphilus]
MKLNIKPMDAAWFYIEKANPPAHFGPLIILSPPEHANPGYVQEFVNQWRNCKTFAAPFNYLLTRSLRPKWQILEDSQVDLEYHFRHSALPKPGSEQELGVLVSRLHSHPLDRSRPLWECHVIEGLEHGRFAVYLKLHHGQLDGMGAVKLIERVFSTDPAAQNLLPPWSIGMNSDAKHSGSAEITSRKATKKSRLPELTKKAVMLSKVGLKAANYVIDAYDGLHPELSAPFKAPNTILNGRISDQRRYATQHYKLDRLKRVAKTADVKMNAVFLSICGGALRRYLAEQQSLPAKSMVGQVPVSIRAADDSSIGNALAFIYANLGTNVEDPLERLIGVHKSAESAKFVQESLPKDGITAFTMLMTAPFISSVIMGMGGYLSPAANLVISNVSGPRQRLYFNGARVEHIYGPSVLFHGQALNITMSSYYDQVDIGFTGCRDSLPSMQKLAVYTGEELQRLEAALGIKPAKPAVAKGKPATALKK